MVSNRNRLTDPFDPTQPIFNLFNQYKDISTLAAKGEQPISSRDKTASAYVLLKSSGDYDRVIEDWDDFTAAQNTCTKFKNHSISAYRQLKNQNKRGMANNLSNAIPELISDELYKVSSQIYEGQKQLANYAEASKTLKQLMGGCCK